MLTTWREGNCCFSHNHHYRELMVLNNSNIINQIKLWKEAETEKNCKIRCLEGNNKKFTTDDGRDWYVLVVQQFSPRGEMVEMRQCPMALLLFGFMVSGYVYAFAEEETRNEMFEKINNPNITQTNITQMIIPKQLIENLVEMVGKERAINLLARTDEKARKFVEETDTEKVEQRANELLQEVEAEDAEHRAKILLEKAEKKAKKLLEEQEAEEKAKKCFEELERMEEAEETKKASPKSKKEKKPKAQKPKTNPYPEMVSIAKDIWKKNPKWVKWEKENK